MRITGVYDLHADGGYRTCSYLKMTTDDGLTGWAEFSDGLNGNSIIPLIHRFAKTIEGMDPRRFGLISATLHATTRLASGGLNHQAIAVLENSCLDLAAKATGVSVATLLGGPYRDRLPLYWTHCGSFRVLHADLYEREFGMEGIRDLDGFRRIGAEATALGFSAVKTNPVLPTPEGGLRFFNAGFRPAPGFLDRVIERQTISAIVDQLSALRDGLGRHTGLFLDVNFSQRPEGYLRIARAIQHLDIDWLELDIPDPAALATLRRMSPIPIASLESFYGLSAYKAALDADAVDICIVDPIWNGVWTAAKIAVLAEAHEMHIAPHNAFGDLGTLMSAHLAAGIVNNRILEYRYDEAPWTHGFLTHPITIDNGVLILPDRPGWGSDIDEEALRARPPRALKR